MSFDSRDQASRLFQALALSKVASAEPVAFSSLVEVGSRKIPEFLVRRESTLFGTGESLRALFTRTKLAPVSGGKYFNRSASVTGFRAPGMGLANSFLVHSLLIAGLLYIPYAMPIASPDIATLLATHDVIYYPVPTPKLAKMLPRIAPRGPGGKPGAGLLPKDPPAAGKTKSQGDLTAISKPLHPDNFHQTIIQPASPPDVRIPTDQKLPNIALGTVNAPQKPKFSLDLSIKKPMRENAKIQVDASAPVAATNNAYAMVTMLQPTNAQPKMPIPIGAFSKPTRRDAENDGTSGGDIPDIGVPGAGKAVLVLGVDPAGVAAQLAVPPGNRAGDFSIAPGSGEAGSPGGRPGGVSGGGSGGIGRGGDGSVGLGVGHEGGGGGREGLPGNLSIKGAANGTGGNLTLDPRFVASAIYPVPWTTNIRKNRMVVSAGPMGGGGLNVYGALPCGKIYTIFLPMKDEGWTMQYCQKGGAGEPPRSSAPTTVIQLEPGLVPPDPDMASRYDFQRVSVPPGKGNKMIVLKGTLQEDGNIDGLEVYQGVVPQMDEAARLAFSRWKFKPAMKAGKPVALDILVGIPPQVAPGQESQ